MTALEQGERQLRHPGLSAIECEFLSAFWRWPGGVEPILIIIIGITAILLTVFPRTGS
jgi:hypothetical protein